MKSFFLVPLLLLGCSQDSGGVVAESEVSASEETLIKKDTVKTIVGTQPIASIDSLKSLWDGVIWPILDQNCSSCHTGSEPRGRFLLETQEQAESAKIVLYDRVIEQQNMPPNGELSTRDMQSLKDWLVSLGVSVKTEIVQDSSQIQSPSLNEETSVSGSSSSRMSSVLSSSSSRVEPMSSSFWGTTKFVYNDQEIKGFFTTHCDGCHSPNLRPLRTTKTNSYDGLTATQGTLAAVLERAVIEKSMPPASKSDPRQVELDAISEWIRAGAPK